MDNEKSYRVIADGHVQTKLGRTCFPKAEAEAIAADLRTRGYAAKLEPWRAEKGTPNDAVLSVTDEGEIGGAS